MVNNRYLSIRETAKTGILSEYALRIMQKCGELPGFFVGVKFVVDTEALEKLLSEKAMASVKAVS